MSREKREPEPTLEKRGEKMISECIYTRKVESEKDKEAIWKLYQEAFKDTTACAQEQRCYSKDTLLKALLDEEYHKFILKKGEKIIGLGLMTSNLEKARITYMNPKRLEEMYPEYKDRIYYFTFLGISVEHQKKARNFFKLVAPMVRYIDQVDGIAAFDFAREKNAELPEMIIKVAMILKKKGEIKNKKIKYSTVGVQEYGAIE
jgi:hypothetical protein